MADELGIINSRYRLVGVTVNERPYSLSVIAQGARIPIVFMEAPSATLSGMRVSAVTAQAFPVSLTTMATAARCSVVFAPPPCSARAVRQVVILTHNEQGTPTYTAQTFGQSISAADFLPAEYVFSMLKNPQVVSHALQEADPTPWPVSNIHEGQSVELVAHDTLAVMPSSLMTVALTAQMELKSLVKEYVPVSMNYQHQIVEKTLVARNHEVMYEAPAHTASMVEKVLKAIPVPGPVHSYTKGLSAVSMALMSRPVPLFVGDTLSHEVVELVLGATDTELPISHSESASSVSMALIGYNEESPVSEDDSASTAESVLIDAKDQYNDKTVGEQYARSASMRALVNTSYPTPNGLSGINTPQQVEMALVDRLDPFPRVHAQIGQQGVEWLVDSNYPTPESMLPVSKQAISANYAHETLMLTDIGYPISTMIAPSTSLLTTVSEETLSPEQMLVTGLFARTIAEQVAAPAEYDSAKNANSFASSNMAVQVLAHQDDTFPSKSYSTSTLSVNAAVGVVAALDDTFPSKDVVHSLLLGSGAYEVVAINDGTFPSKDAVVSFQKASLVAATTAFTANDYPPKNMVQSNCQAMLVSSFSAVSTAYPSKNEPMSVMASSMVGQVIASKDTSMYVMPERSIRRRPNISVTIIY